MRMRTDPAQYKSPEWRPATATAEAERRDVRQQIGSFEIVDVGHEPVITAAATQPAAAATPKPVPHCLGAVGDRLADAGESPPTGEHVS